MNGFNLVHFSPNVQHCLDVYQELVNSTMDAALKKKGQEAVDYLKYSFAGRVQTMGGHGCPKIIIG